MSDFLIRKDNLRDTHWGDDNLPPLEDGKARLKVDKFALTANNVTYATFGEAMNYWNFFPAADEKYGRVPVWGFATVTESKASSSVTIAVGSPRSQVRDDAPTRPAEAALNRTGKFFRTSAEEV